VRQEGATAEIEAALLKGEEVEAVFDMKGGGTEFLGTNTRRVSVYDTHFCER
jgi:tartrate dehydratase alpha subunit/fumarate hydratase class I-like protein